VLVVDDEPAVGRSIRRVLSEHDVTVVTRASDGLELLDAGKRFDIIISDLMMPGMSGMDFYDELVRRFPDTAARVVFVSGGAFTANARAFLDRLSNERILKPFDPQRLRETVARYVTPQPEHAETSG
jgi:CheY-like chemotaxis protein